MNKNGPVIIIEDDADDQDFLKEVFQKLKYPNELISFADGQEALDFLNSGKVVPFTHFKKNQLIFKRFNF